MNSRFLLLVLFVSSIGLASGQSGTNSTELGVPNPSSANTTAPAYLKDCRLTPSHIQPCAGHGVCNRDGTCRCYLGYGKLLSGDCGYTPLMGPDGPKYIPVIRIFCGVAFGLLTLLTSWRIFIEFRNRYSAELAPIKNLTKFALSMLFLYSFFNMLGCLDYWGIYGVVSNAGYLFVHLLPFPIAICLFAAIILHWIEVYHVSTLTLRREEMIQKINSNYTSTISIEDILLKVTFLRKFRAIFAVIVALALALLVAFHLVYFYVKDFKSFWYFFNFWLFYFLLCWVCLGVGFLTYGVRMYRLMPDAVRPKIFSITVLALLTVFSLVIELVLEFCLFHLKGDTWGILITFYVLRFVEVFCALNIYMPLWDWKKWFHSDAVTSSGSRSKSKSINSEMNSNSAHLSGTAQFSGYAPESSI